MEIWAYPQTTFSPPNKLYDSCTLYDENDDLTGRNIVKYSYLGAEQPVNSWIDMFEHVVKFLHQKDTSILTRIALGSSDNDELATYISIDGTGQRLPLKIDDDLYIEKNTSTLTKLSILRKIFTAFEVDPMDLVFFLKDTDLQE